MQKMKGKSSFFSKFLKVLICGQMKSEKKHLNHRNSDKLDAV